jgi:hypothetical protein
MSLSTTLPHSDIDRSSLSSSSSSSAAAAVAAAAAGVAKLGVSVLSLPQFHFTDDCISNTTPSLVSALKCTQQSYCVLLLLVDTFRHSEQYHMYRNYIPDS